MFQDRVFCEMMLDDLPMESRTKSFQQRGKPQLNPIEIVWAILKKNCSKKLRKGISFKDVLKHLQDAFDNEVSKQTAEKLYRHVSKKEEKFWKYVVFIH